jgi:hypothetical protein
MLLTRERKLSSNFNEKKDVQKGYQGKWRKMRKEKGKKRKYKRKKGILN